MLCRLSCKNELKGSGQLLVHRAMQKMVRQQYGLNVTTDKVYDLMFELDPEGLQARGRVSYRKELNGEETSPPNLGVTNLWAIKTLYFPFTNIWIYRFCKKETTLAEDLDFKFQSTTGKWYLKHLIETKIISTMLKVDKGTGTGTMATMHSFLRRHHGDMDPHGTVLY